MPHKEKEICVDKDYNEALLELDKKFPGSMNDPLMKQLIEDLHKIKEKEKKQKLEKKEKRKGIRNRGLITLGIFSYISGMTIIGTLFFNKADGDFWSAGNIAEGFVVFNIFGTVVLAAVIVGIANLVKWILTGETFSSKDD